MTLFRGFKDDVDLWEWLQEHIWPAEAKLEAEDVYWGTLLACIEMLKAGVTTFVDMYFLWSRWRKRWRRRGCGLTWPGGSPMAPMVEPRG